MTDSFRLREDHQEDWETIMTQTTACTRWGSRNSSCPSRIGGSLCRAQRNKVVQHQHKFLDVQQGRLRRVFRSTIRNDLGFQQRQETQRLTTFSDKKPELV